VTIAEWQIVHGMVDSDCTTDMLDEAQRRPAENIAQIENRAFGPLGVRDGLAGTPGRSAGWDRFYAVSERFRICHKLKLMSAKNYQININPELVKIGARVLQAPELAFNGGKAIKPDKAAWNLNGFPFISVRTPNLLLAIIKVGPKINNYVTAVRVFEGHLRTEMGKYGVTVANEGQIPIRHATWPSGDPVQQRTLFMNNLDAAFRSLANGENPLLSQPAMTLVVLPKRHIRQYSEVKWWGDCHKGIRTACITMKAVKKKQGRDFMLLGNVR
jgi:hypothetical protein